MLITVIVILILYILSLILAIFKDHRAKIQRLVIVLGDNYPLEDVAYLVAVYTGESLCAGTNANVGLRLLGSKGKSRPHILKSANRRTLQRSTDDWFLLFTPRHLGNIEYLHLWHDNAGLNPDWFCKKIIVYDLETQEEYNFVINEWLAARDKTYLEVFQPPLNKGHEPTTSSLIFENVLLGLRHMHVWVAAINRHPRSAVNRAQNVAMCMCSVMVSMLISILFYYNAGDDKHYFYLSPKDIQVSFLCSITSTIVISILFFMFWYSQTGNIIKKVDETKLQPEIKEPSIVKISKLKKSYIHEKLGNESSEDNKNNPQKETRKTGKAYERYLKIVHTFFETKRLKPIKLGGRENEKPISEKIGLLIVAWALSQIMIIICATLVIDYGLNLNNVNSRLWLFTSFFGVFLDIVLFTPLKIFGISILLGCANKVLFETATFDINIERAVSEELVGNVPYLFRLQLLRSGHIYHPLSREQVLQLREQRNFLINWSKFLEFLILFTFMWLLLLLVLNSDSARFYYKNEEIRKVLDNPTIEFPHRFNDILHLDDFEKYICYNFFPKVYKTLWYIEGKSAESDLKLGDDSWFIDKAHTLIDVPKIRQLRVHKGKCILPNIIRTSYYNKRCVGVLEANTEETKHYKNSWNKLNTDADPAPSPWVYVKVNTTKDTEIQGFTRRLYHGGGYIIDLGRNIKDTNFTLSEMFLASWLDLKSRFVVVELTLYNVNTNSFSILKYIVEILPGGVLVLQNTVVSVEAKAEYIARIILFVIITAFFLFKNIYILNEEGLKNYFSGIWNLFELILLEISIENLFLYLGYTTPKNMEDIHITESAVTFDYAHLLGFHESIILLLFGIIIGCTIRILRTYYFGKRIITIFYTFSFSAKLVFVITIYFILLLLLQSLVIAYMINEPFITTSNMFFTYKTAYKNLRTGSVFPHKMTMVFIFCLSVAYFNIFFSLLYSYYFRIAKGHKILKPELLNYVTLVKDEMNTLLSTLKLKKINKNEKTNTHSVRLQGGMDIVSPSLPKSYEKLMLYWIKKIIKSIIQTTKSEEEYSQLNLVSRKIKLRSDPYKYTRKVIKILKYETNKEQYCTSKMPYCDSCLVNLSCVLLKLDDLLTDDNEGTKLD